jgi:hypothetical protein
MLHSPLVAQGECVHWQQVGDACWSFALRVVYSQQNRAKMMAIR